jgi:hypothetical protein
MGIAAIGGSQTSAYAAQAAGIQRLTPEQQQQVQKLKSTDQKVREHEAAHMAAGAGLTGGAHLEYVRGPDGKQYAVAGEVKIDVSPAQTPEQTIDKARRIQAAALAPADPSAQDRAVAAQAAQMAAKAQAELNRQESPANQAAESNANVAAPIARALSAYADQTPQPDPLISLFA